MKAQKLSRVALVVVAIFAGLFVLNIAKNEYFKWSAEQDFNAAGTRTKDFLKSRGVELPPMIRTNEPSEVDEESDTIRP